MAGSQKNDPLEDKMEAALDPGTFIPYRKAFSFDQELQEVANVIEEIMDTDPKRAASLFETFIAACHEKTEEVDDSSGLLVLFVEQLFVKWIRSCQAANINRKDIVALVAWIEDDPYGFCYRLEDEIVSVMDKECLEFFASAAKSRSSTILLSDSNVSKTPRDAQNRQWTSGDACRIRKK